MLLMFYRKFLPSGGFIGHSIVPAIMACRVFKVAVPIRFVSKQGLLNITDQRFGLRGILLMSRYEGDLADELGFDMHTNISFIAIVPLITLYFGAGIGVYLPAGLYFLLLPFFFRKRAI